MDYRPLRRQPPALVVRHGCSGGVGVVLPVAETHLVTANRKWLRNLDGRQWAFVMVAAATVVTEQIAPGRHYHQLWPLLFRGQGIAEYAANRMRLRGIDDQQGEHGQRAE